MPYISHLASKVNCNFILFFNHLPLEHRITLIDKEPIYLKYAWKYFWVGGVAILPLLQSLKKIPGNVQSYLMTALRYWLKKKVCWSEYWPSMVQSIFLKKIKFSLLAHFCTGLVGSHVSSSSSESNSLHISFWSHTYSLFIFIHQHLPTI